MANEKERFELLLEEVRDGVKLVVEGHSVIRREMQEMKNELKEDIKLVDNKVEFLGADLRELKQDVRKMQGKVDKIDRTLEEHIKLPVHLAV